MTKSRARTLSLTFLALVGPTAVVVAQPAAGPGSPAVVAVETRGVVRYDPSGTIRTLLPAEGDPVSEYDVQDLVVDEARGTWVVTRQRSDAGKAGIKGVHAAARWELVFGDQRGVTRIGTGDPLCASTRPSCFQVALAFSPRGDDVVVVSMARVGTTVGHAAVARGGWSALMRRPIGDSFTLDPAHDLAAYASKSGLYLATWTPTGLGTSRHIAIPGTASLVSFAGDGLYYNVEASDAERRMTSSWVERFDLRTGTRAVVYRPQSKSIAPWTLFPTSDGKVVLIDCPPGHESWAPPPHGGACDAVEVGPSGARTVARGVSIIRDVSTDGRYMVVSRMPTSREGRKTAWPDLVVIDVVTGTDVWTIPEVQATSAQFAR